MAVEGDSDENKIVNNTITSTDAASIGLVRQFPEEAPSSVKDTQEVNQGNEIQCGLFFRVGHCKTSSSGAKLIQFVSIDPQATDLEDYRPESDHNLIEGNLIIDNRQSFPPFALPPPLRFRLFFFL